MSTPPRPRREDGASGPSPGASTGERRAEGGPRDGAASLRPWRRLARGAAIVGAYALLVALTHRELWLAPTPLTLGGDAATSYWQDVAFAVEALRGGELPLWNPYERGGYPFAADPQAALWSPLSWLTYLLGITNNNHKI